MRQQDSITSTIRGSRAYIVSQDGFLGMCAGTCAISDKLWIRKAGSSEYYVGKRISPVCYGFKRILWI